MKAIATLPLILILGALVLEITLVFSFLTFYLNLESSQLKNAQKALYLAEGCLHQEIIALIRDRDHESQISPSPCVVEIDNSGTQATITVSVTIKKVTKKIQAKLNIDQNTGKVTLVSWKEIPA
ncbi:hypothetical protein J7J41_01585 [bacterium]|nr:hypothetical protein [bacterium]